MNTLIKACENQILKKKVETFSYQANVHEAKVFVFVV